MKLLLTFLPLLVFSPLAHAECVTEVQATVESSCVVMERSGVRGVWFSLEEAENIHEMRLAVPELLLQISSFERMLEIEGHRIDSYQEANYEYQQSIELLQAQLATAAERETRLRESIGAWYRSPVLWLSVGMVITTAAYVAIAYGVD